MAGFRTTVATIAALLLVQNSAQSRIGWTLEQCRGVYGKETNVSIPPAGVLHEVFEFSVGNFFVGVTFLRDKVAYVYYFKKGSDRGKKFSDEEINNLLEKNGSGVVWKPQGIGGKPHEDWIADVKTLYLLWTAYEGETALMSAEYSDDSLTNDPRPTLSIQTIEYRKLAEEDSERRLQELQKQDHTQLGQQWTEKAKQRKEQETNEKKQKKQAADKATEGL
jgi:hypothetical protein